MHLKDLIETPLKYSNHEECLNVNCVSFNKKEKKDIEKTLFYGSPYFVIVISPFGGKIKYDHILLTDNQKYQLISVGMNTGGHYISYSKRNNSWYLLDDTNVQVINDDNIIKNPPHLVILLGYELIE
jgi:ubiquitin C-terminal hydrolase